MKTFVIIQDDGTKVTQKAEGVGYDDAGNLALLVTKKRLATPDNPSVSFVTAIRTFNMSKVTEFYHKEEVDAIDAPASGLEQVA